MSVAQAIDSLLAAAIVSAEHDATIRRELELGAERVQSGLSALVLRTLLGLDVRDLASDEQPSNRAEQTRHTLTWLTEAMGRVPALARAAGASSGLLTDPSLPLASGERLGTWVRPEDAGRLLEAVTDQSGPPGAARPREAGVVYEELLEVRVRRLDAESICVKPRRTWVSARDVLAEAPRERAKWLMAYAELPKSSVQRLGQALATAESEVAVFAALERLRAPGTRTLPAHSLVVESAVARRRSGSHFTPGALCRTVIERTLAPLFASSSDSKALLRLRICDPSMGSGAFLEACARSLADRLLSAWQDEGRPQTPDIRAQALRAVVTNCLYGVDKDPVAVDLARCALARLAETPGTSPPDLSDRLRCGDALVGCRSAEEDARLSAMLVLLGAAQNARFDWHRAFPDVFGHGDPGFDACIGNPPWVAYAGRAAQPLDEALSDFYLKTNPAFHGYRTLHGLFVRRATELLRPGGRLGFVLPTSVADLDGYRPTRRAHDALAEVDGDLDDFGDGAFDGVFQPCMALTSTRRRATSEPRHDSEWQLARSDLDDVGAGLLGRLSAYPKIDPALFGERGFQTTGRDLAHIRRLEGPELPFVEPIREGVDVQEFQLGQPRCFLDPNGLTGRFRAKPEWNDVAVLIRQTARYPIAALGDGVAFRNSVLAGFSNDDWTPAALAAYLNSTVVRYFHFVRHRDARQGMPQLKIGHLRSLPAIRDGATRAALDAIGRKLGATNAGVGATERTELDSIVFDAFDLRLEERELVMAWATKNPLPKRRAGIARHAEGFE